ncbi:MAG: anaerobic ribonucleoside-triphosphate reductase activating protein [Candidatus Izemoplasmatales bacterium]|jgi:pyruvate formate lyase activating enzyme
MIFSGIVKTSLIDYPGKIAAVLFTPGCNYNCFYCHNRHLIEDFPEIIPTDEIDHFLQKRVGLLDGIVISGGEPTLHEGLIPYLKKLKSLGYLTKVDTNGSRPEVIQALVEKRVVDYFAIDYKAPKARYYEIARGESNPEDVLATIDILLKNRCSFEVRTTVVPQLSLTDLILMSEEMPQVPRYVLNAYKAPSFFLSSDQSLIDEPAYSEKTISEFAETLKLYQPHVVLMF